MSIVPLPRNPSPRQLAVFGVLWLLLLGAAGGLVLARGGNWLLAAVIWAVAVGVPAIGWALPAWLRRLYLAAMYAAFPLGFIVSHAILAAVYYFVVTPVGLAMRMAGRDPMNKRFDPEARTYWTERRDPEDPRRYFRQY